MRWSTFAKNTVTAAPPASSSSVSVEVKLRRLSPKNTSAISSTQMAAVR
jgi:hypothetical protein